MRPRPHHGRSTGGSPGPARAPAPAGRPPPGGRRPVGRSTAEIDPAPPSIGENVRTPSEPTVPTPPTAGVHRPRVRRRLRSPPAMKRLASWCVRHRVIVVLLWLAALVGMSHRAPSPWAPPTPTASPCPTPSPPTPCHLLQAAAPSVAGDREQIVFHTTDGTKVTDPAVEGTGQHHAGQGARPCPTSPRSPVPTTPPVPPRSATTAGPPSPPSPSTSRPSTSPPPMAKHVRGHRPDRRRAEPPGGGGRPGGRGGRPAVVRRHRTRA